MSYYYLKEVDFMLKKIHDFTGVMFKGAVFGVPLIAVECIVWGIAYVITGVIDKKVN